MSVPGNLTSSYSAEDVLQFLQNSGTIDMDDVALNMKKEKQNRILEQHPYPITQGRDGRYRTYIKKEGKGEKRKQIAKASYEKVVDTLVAFYEGQIESKPEAVTIGSLYKQWTEYKALHRAAPAYLSRIDDDWRSYYAGTEIIEKPIKELTKLELDMWAHALIERVGRSKKAYYNASLPMRQILDYAVDAELIEDNVFRRVKIDSKMVFDPVKKPPSESQVFSAGEIEALHEIAWREFQEGHNTVHKLTPLAILFQLQTGVRIGELCALRYEDIHENEIYVNRMFRFREKAVVEYTKGHHDGRYVPLTSEARTLIQMAKAYQKEHNLDDAGYIFSVQTDTPLSYYSIMKAYRRYCDIMGCVRKSSHKSRKTFISALIDGGVNINTIRDIAGHASEKTTFSNYCYDRKSKAERAELIEEALSQTV